LTQFMEAAGVRRGYARLLRRLLEILKEDGLLEGQDGLWKVVSSQRVSEMFSATKTFEFVSGVGGIEAELLHRCGSHLSSVLRGQIEPLSILFPANGSVSAAKLYSSSLGARILNQLASDAVRELLATLPTKSPVRVLEIGAGTGSATAELLQLFDAEVTRYTITDITPVLVNRSRDRFEHLGFVDFALLDIERSPDAQGFESGGYDIILAASVLHATRDIAESIRHARQLLRPGGILVLLELTSRLRFIDLIFGLTEGWWRFSDAPLRQHYPLISASEWEKVLLANGFSDCATLGTNDPADGIISQQAVIIAQANSGSDIRVEAENSRWVFLGDRSGIAERVAGLFPNGSTRLIFPSDKAVHSIVENLSSCPGTTIVDFRSCDARIEESSNTLEVARACELAAGPALELLQALATLHGHPVPIWFVTQGLASLPYPSATTLPQSLVWGMLKSVALEHPAWKCGCIDLSGDAPIRELHALVNELRGGIADREVALREDRWVSRLARANLPASASFSARGGATYLITGGSRGLGPVVAHWLARCGATHLALLSRTEPDEEAQHTLDVVRGLGCQLEIFRADVADEGQLRDVLAAIEAAMPPLRGIVHGAGVLDDAMLTHQTWERFKRVLRAKTEGAWNLHRLTVDVPLDFFVLFSSMASLFGSPGQSNHAAANAFLDALACYRRGQGLAALSINWGPWAEQGAAVQRSAVNRIRDRGVGGIATGAGLRALERCLGSRASQLGVIDVNWPLFLEQFAVDRRTTLLEAFAPTPQMTLGPRVDPAVKRSASLLACRVLEADARSRPKYLREYVESRVREIAAIPTTHELASNRSLIELGFDSLMSTELRNRFLAELSIDLPIQALIAGESISAVLRLIDERLTLKNPSGDRFIRTELELEEIRI
jgi:NAD(P)-dependent dehydrogenase (short-subunit alcohol dehydrogenase family)/SAM-dependent methyltransferase